jgi:hypothetical protein
MLQINNHVITLSGSPHSVVAVVTVLYRLESRGSLRDSSNRLPLLQSTQDVSGVQPAPFATRTPGALPGGKTIEG